MRTILLLMALMFISCHEYITIEDNSTDNVYHLVFKNATDGDLFIQCSQIAWVSSVSLGSMEKSDTLSSPNSVITVKYFGDGSSYQQREVDFELEKYATTLLELVAYP